MSPADDEGPIGRLLLIKALPLFAGVHPDELAVVAEHAQLHAFRAGETLFGGPEAPVGAIHLVLEGRVTEQRNGRPFRTHGPQQVLGGIDALAGAATGMCAVADEDTRTLALDRTALRDILEDNFGLLSAALQGVAAATLRLRRRLPAAGFAPAGPPPAEPPFDDTLVARMAALRDTPWLGRAGVRTLGQLAREADVVSHASGERLWAPGETAEHGVLVLRGALACTTAAGEAFAVGRGTLLGLEEALAMEPRWGSAMAPDGATLLALERAALIDALDDDPDSAVEVLAALATVASALRDRVARDAAA